MAYRGKGIRGGRDRAFMVTNGSGIDNFGNQNHYRNEIKELSEQIATLSDNVQLLLMKRRVATLIKKVHRLLPPSECRNGSQIRFESTFNYKKMENLGDDLEESYGPVNPAKFEGEMNLIPNVFDEAKEHGYFNGFSIFDEYPSKELEGFLGNDCAFEIEDLPIFDESLNEGFEVDLEGIPVYDEYPSEYKDIDDDVLPKLDEFPHEEFEDDSVFKSSGEFENVPIHDEFEEEFCVDNEEGKLVDMIKENFFVDRQESKAVISEDPSALVVSPKLDEVVFDYPPMSEEFGEPKLDDCFHYLPSELHMVQGVFELALCPHTLGLPKEGNDDLGQLVDPLGFVFKQASFEHSVVTFQRAMVDSSWCDLEMCVMWYYGDILIYKTHGTWMISLHVSMDAVDVYKNKLILKIGCGVMR